MVRAGVVHHPSDYNVSGNNEIQQPTERYRIIDCRKLQEYFSLDDVVLVRQEHRNWVENELRNEEQEQRRKSFWSDSVAVGSESFLHYIHHQLGWRAKGRTVTIEGSATVLQEPGAAYMSLLGGEKTALRHNNTYFWNDNNRKTGHCRGLTR